MNVDEFDQKPELKPEDSGRKPVAAAKADADKARPEPTASRLETTPEASKRPGGGLAWFALLLALLALAAAAWLWWQDQQDRQQQAAQWQAERQVYTDELKRLESSLANLQSTGSQQSAEMSGDLQRRLEILESNQDSGESFRSETAAWSRAAQAALEDSQLRLAAVDERLGNLSARSAESSTELELEEIDYLLRMAQERLQLFGDTRTADRALQLADQQVQAFDNPMFIGLRREISAARQALTAADLPDMVALSTELDKVQQAIAALPFLANSEDAGPVAADAASETHWWERLKSALSGLVTVRRIDENELAVPALADQQALRQRAWLELEQARLAALRREQTIYQDSLSQAGETIDRWFDSNDAAVKQALVSIQALSQRNVNPDLPDISGPWTVLNSIREAGLSPAVLTENALPVAEPDELEEDDQGQLDAQTETVDDSTDASREQLHVVEDPPLEVRPEDENTEAESPEDAPVTNTDSDQ